VTHLLPSASGSGATESGLFGEVDFQPHSCGRQSLEDQRSGRWIGLLRQSFAGSAPRFQRAIDLEVQGRAGEPLTVVARDEQGRVVEAKSDLPLAVAQNQPLTELRLREQLGRLGGTAFRLGG